MSTSRARYRPFKEGVCTMHVPQWYHENAGGGPFGDPNYQATYSVEVTLYDDGTTHKIGFKARTDAPYQMVLSIVMRVVQLTRTFQPLTLTGSIVCGDTGRGRRLCSVQPWHTDIPERRWEL
jgi:hypothetical protein